MKIWAQKYAARIRQGHRRRGETGTQLAEQRALFGIFRVARIFGTGQMAHHIVERDRVQRPGILGESARFTWRQPEPLHAGVERQDASPTRFPTVFAPQTDVFRAVQYGDQGKLIEIWRGAIIHQPVKDVDCRVRADRLSQGNAFVDGGDKEFSTPGGCQRRAGLDDTDAIPIRLDDSGALGGCRQTAQRAPVVGDRVQINRQDGAGMA